MARYHVTRLLPYTPEQLFALVGDVDRYPEFIPWITAMQTGPVQARGDGCTSVDAQASVGFSFLREAFSTRVLRDAAARRIEVGLISGPFRTLQNVWLFEPHARGCRVEFDIDFQFKARLLDLMLKANFGFAVERLIGCFEGRARQLYGEDALASPAALTGASAPS